MAAKKLENLYVCSGHFTEDCYEVSHRYEMLGAKTTKRILKQDAHRQKFFVCSDKRSKMEIQTIEVKNNTAYGFI